MTVLVPFPQTHGLTQRTYRPSENLGRHDVVAPTTNSTIRYSRFTNSLVWLAAKNAGDQNEGEKSNSPHLISIQILLFPDTPIGGFFCHGPSTAHRLQFELSESKEAVELELVRRSSSDKVEA